ncbi:MAG: DUF2959 family protein [Acidobacteriota bacterium]
MLQSQMSRPVIALVAVLALSCGGCTTIYYAAWEQLGKEKRDLLRDNVEAVHKDQEEVSEQFEDALTRIKELYGFDGGDLEDRYDALKRDYDRSVSAADELKDRIETVNSIAEDLFSEWETELGSISDPNLRQRSRAKLDETKSRFRRMSDSLAKSERSMDPVLQKFEDQVLFLKHNLNAQAVGGLEIEVQDIEREVGRLIDDLKVSIRRSDEFIQALPE